VTREDRAAARLPYEVTEAVIDVVRRTEEAEVAVVFKESDDGLWHVSARSKGQVDVARACVALGGGGHSRAAGFTTGQAVPDALARLRALLAAAGRPGPVTPAAGAAGAAGAGGR
jgi:phosphoesterase RecJ-like protein